MIFLVIGACCLLVGVAVALTRARFESIQSGKLSSSTFLLLFLAHAGFGLSALLAAWWEAWPLPLPTFHARAIGFLIALVGATIYVAARLVFRSFRRTWGLASDRLVIRGVYRFSRNPQSVGWAVFLVGVGIAGRSTVALILAALYWAGCLIWLPVEEKTLEQRFGARYRAYRRAVPRYIGPLGRLH